MAVDSGSGLVDEHVILRVAFDPQMEFRQNVIRSVRAALKRVRGQSEGTVDEARERALHVLSFALKMPEAWSDTRDLVAVMAAQMEQAVTHESWISYLKRAIDLSQAINDEAAQAELSLRLGFLFQLRGDFTGANTYYVTSAELFARNGNQRKVATALNRQAFVAYRANRYSEVMPLIQQVERILPEEDPERAISYMVLGWIEVEKRDWQKSIDYFMKALQITQKQNDQRETARRLRDLAVGMQLNKQYEEAIHCYENAIALFEQLQDGYEQAITRMNLGALFLSVERSYEAYELFTQAEPALIAIAAKPDLGMLYTNQGIVLRNWSRFEEAKDLFNKSIRIFTELHSSNLLAQSQYELALTYLQEGSYNSAIELFKGTLALLETDREISDHRFLHQEISAHMADVQHKGNSNA